MRMSRYFLHIRIKGGQIIPDRIGIEFPSLSAAKADATEAVRQVINENRVSGEPVVLEALEISDRAGRLLALVSFDMDVAPPPPSTTLH